MEFPPSLFDIYIDKIKNELELLSSFQMPPFEPWVIDWTASQAVASIKGKNKPWHSIEAFQTLLSNVDKPAIYYFTVPQQSASQVFEIYQRQKEASSLHRREQDIREPGFFSYSHVPDKFNGGNCIYVGSVKNGIHGRLINHLGHAEKGRTGALYLYQVIKLIDPQPPVTFHFCLLNKKYINLTKHIECVIQDKLRPFIGKRALEDFTPYSA